MNQKGFASIVLIVVIVVLAGVVGYFAFQKRQAPAVPLIGIPSITETQPQTIPLIISTPPESIIVTGNSFPTNIDGYFEMGIDDGYFQYCGGNAAMYKRVNNSWERVSRELPGKGLYYLDDKFIGYVMCDFIVCSKLPKPYTMQLIEYKKVGEKAPPPDINTMGNTLPVYQTVSLSGDVKIDIQYFSDKNCQNKKFFSTVIKR